MNMPDHIPILAVDGGGTRCRMAYVSDGEVTQVETGPANATSDFDGAVREILSGLSLLGSRLTLSHSDLATCPTFVGLAGVIGPDIAEALRTALPFEQVRITDDRPAALRGALGNTDGFLAHCGTGSFFGRQLQGQPSFVGGWGHILGDEASAYWIGRAALRATLTSVDGLSASSGLTQDLLREFEGPNGIVGFAKEADPEDIAALAQRVTAANNKGDLVARTIMQSGADKIVEALRALGWTPGASICLAGGIGAHFAHHLPHDMCADIIAPKGTALDGAISLAREIVA